MNFQDKPYLDSISVLRHKGKRRERVSKIKVPFFCKYHELKDNGELKAEEKLGKVHYDDYIPELPLYVLEDLSKQRPQNESNLIARYGNLSDLIKDLGINVGKVKIIYWEE